MLECPTVNHSVQILSSSSSPHIPPNFLLPSPTSAFSAPAAPFLLPPPSSSLPSTSSSLGPSLVEEMARRKRSPKNIHWHRQTESQPNTKAEKCQLCLAQMPDPKPPVEGEDYFIDNDGTLTIKNGVCPRSLALTLFSEVAVTRVKYEKLLGENLDKFLLNLKQIIEKHREICPGEDPSDLINAQNVLKAYTTANIQKFPMSRKRTHEFISGGERNSLMENLQRNKLELSEDVNSAVFPENFLHTPPSVTTPLQRSSSQKGKTSGVLSEPHSPMFSPSFPATKLDDSSGIPAKDVPSDAGSTGGSSRVSSPTPSLSSVTSGLGLSDAAKQMANTKRGSKILPVSTNGQTHYLCPVCSIELSSDHELTVHIRSHNQSGQQTAPNSCTICGKTLSSQSSLDRHMLVHSGERPFRCKICDMSFTTNGNMHRHARIHEKNGISTGHKPASRKQSEPKASSKDNLLFRQEKLLSGPPTGMGAAQRPSVTPDFGPEKMGLFTTPQQHHEQTAFLQQYYSMMFPYSAHHPAFPYHHLLQDPARMALPFYQAMLDPMSGKNPARRAMLPHQFLPPVREPSPDLRTQQKFTCSECNAVFNNQFALESHMESHIIVDEELEAESGTACKKCKKVVKSEESLLLHHLTHHKVKEELAEPDTKPGQKSPSSSSPPSSSAAATTATGSSSPTNSSGNNSKVTVGFQNLGFANFTSKKFPLIAKAYCESNPGLKGSKFPSFQCEKCEQEFPVEGAKNLHEASHVPEEYTVCPKCDCHFADSSRLQDHMRKHVADVKFEESNGKNCEEVVESMSQPYFLAQLGLVARDDSEDKNMIYDADDMDIIVKDDSVLSDNEDSKVANSLNSDIDEDNRSESSKISLTGEDKAANNSLSLPPSIFLHPNTAVPGSSNSNTPAVPPSMKPSQNLSEVSPNLLPNVLNSRSPTPSGDSDGDPSSRDSPIGVSDGSMPPMFPCKYCDMVLSSPRALKYHQRTHKDTSQFQCRVCNYSSTDKSTLLRHMRTHSGERPYKCVICDYSFTTKANCERHLRQKHDVDKDQLAEKLTCNKYIIANTKSSPTMLDREASGSQPEESLCKSCGIDFYTWRGLQQHLHVSPDCRTRYMCKICKTTVSSRQSLLHHMNTHHGDISAQQWEKYIVTVENPVGSPTSENKPVLSTPPPAHSKQTKSQIGNFSKAGLNFEQVVVKKEPNFPYFDKAEKSELAEKMDALLKQRNKERRGEMSVEKPLDFSKQQKLDACVSQLHQSLNLSRASSVSLSEDDQSLDEVPMDLTVSRPSLPSSWSKGQGHNLGSQSTYGFPRPVKEESRTSSKLRQIATNNNNNNSSKQNAPTNSKGSNIPFIVENPNQPRRSDGNNNQLSPLLGHVSSRNTAIVQQLSPARPTSGGSKPETSATSLSPHPAKHPAFPTFPIVSPYSTLLPPAGAASLAFQAHPALSAVAQKLAFLPNIHPSLLPSAIPQVGGPNVAFLSVNETAAKSRSHDKDTPDDAKNDLPKSGKNSASQKDTEGEDHKKRDVLEKNTSLKEADKDDKVKSSKESTSGESDSSCELASVNKILDATDAQNFQEFLAIPETEDEDENRSESVASGEDSNLSLENMYSNSQSLAAGTLARARLGDEATEEGKEEGTKGTSVTVNMALIDNSIPEVIKEKVLREEAGYNDPSNMSEQAIAALIEKVSRENVNSPAKKKRNSYADSPHKFTCPYCPRCFPWLSSLNRHLLTHTGQKPFKCPRCPVTFSTKSNRERHLIRKHNVNMLDPASRSTMDRPYKCHLCVFSSFSTQSNLIKHYKDRHSDVSPPQHLLEAGDKALSDGEGEDGLLNGGASYEDEEEYNALAEMRGSLSDKEIMLQNYAQDSDSNHSGNSISSLRYPYRKRNAIFNINGEEEQINSSSNGSKVNGGNNLINHSAAGIGNKNNSLSPYTKPASVPTTRPGIDDTVLTDTMKNFLDKSVRQALEDSHKRALEEGSKFIITPAIERHLRRLPNVDDAEFDLSTSQATQCSICDAQFSSHKLLVKHIKQEHSSEPPFKCYLCEMSFTSRVECLQHQAQSHQAVWNILKEKNEIGNVQVFSTRLDKRIEKLCKKGKDLLDKQEKEDLNGESDDLTTAADLDKSTAEVEKTSDNNAVEDLSDKSASKEKNEDNTNNDDNDDKADTSLLQDVVTTDYLQRKIHCAFCSKRFWSLQDLRRHMRSHTGEQPYKCDICSQKFTLKHSMNRHMAKHHAGVKDGSSGVDVGTDDEESESDAGKPRTRSSQKAVTSLVSKVKNISAAGENNINSSDKNNNNNISNGDNKKEDGNESDDDMLHNLLGVESSTIDQIFESKDSAASLLGV